jgi:NADPH:quinone reductase-like Zn-dependent oxidoreductase
MFGPDKLRLLAASQLKHQIAEIYPPGQAAMAHKRMERGHTVGKLLLHVASG